MADSLEDVLKSTAKRKKRVRVVKGVPEIELKKPVSADPETGELYTLEQIGSGEGKRVSLDSLHPDTLGSLVSERIRMSPQHEIQIIDGRSFNKSEMLEEIDKGSEIGQQLVQAERLLIDYVEKRYEGGEQ